MERRPQPTTTRTGGRRYEPQQPDAMTAEPGAGRPLGRSAVPSARIPSSRSGSGPSLVGDRRRHGPRGGGRAESVRPPEERRTQCHRRGQPRRRRARRPRRGHRVGDPARARGIARRSAAAALGEPVWVRSLGELPRTSYRRPARSADPARRRSPPGDRQRLLARRSRRAAHARRSRGWPAAIPDAATVDRVVAELRHTAAQLRAEFPGSTALVGGGSLLVDSIVKISASDLERGEAVALPIALVVMLLVFGGFLAAGHPVARSDRVDRGRAGRAVRHHLSHRHRHHGRSTSSPPSGWGCRSTTGC